MIVKVAKSITKLAQDDPRRVTHSVKVGLAVTLVSLFYYSQSLYHDLGPSALWAVLTVIVVFEFTVGAALGKGLNRAMATLVGGGLGVGAHSLADKCGYIGEPILIAVFVFFQASASTFMRFFPQIKARCDYGFMISTLTFSFISISEFRVEEIVELARERLATIVIGVFGSLLISVLVFPVWAGEDLHYLVANNIDKLGDSLTEFGIAYFKMQNDGEPVLDEKPALHAYMSALNTKNTEESLANFAKWEPRHGQFRFRHPWKQYLKLGALTRECAYKIDALNSHLNSNVKAQPRFENNIGEVCNRTSIEASKTLKELAVALKTMTEPSSCKAHIAKSKESKQSLDTLLESSSLLRDFELLQIIPAATVASIVIDIVNCTEKIAACTFELASLAHFKVVELQNSKPLPENVDKLEPHKTTSANQDQSSSEIRIGIVDLNYTVVTPDGGD